VENDTVVNEHGKTVWHSTPDSVERYLVYRLKRDPKVHLCRVHVGKTGETFTVAGYMNRDKIEAIQQLLVEMLDRQDTRPYKGVARRLFTERMAKKIIDLI